MWLLGRYYSGFYVGMNAIPSTATIILGVMAGQLIMSRLARRKTMLILLIAGLSGVALGFAVSPWLPLIKRIWTPSFALFAGGWTTLILLFFYWSLQAMGWKKCAFSLVIVGMNSIAAYVLGNAFGGWFRSASSAWISWLSQPLGVWYPVLQHFLFLCAAWGALYWLYRRKIFFKM
jgi:predicted acyltransferase